MHAFFLHLLTLIVTDEITASSILFGNDRNLALGRRSFDVGIPVADDVHVRNGFDVLVHNAKLVIELTLIDQELMEFIDDLVVFHHDDHSPADLDLLRQILEDHWKEIRLTFGIDASVIVPVNTSQGIKIIFQDLLLPIEN